MQQAMTKKSSLTVREYEVVRELRKGHTNRLIAEVMGISSETVKSHVSNIFRKLEFFNRSQVANYFTDEELTERLKHTMR